MVVDRDAVQPARMASGGNEHRRVIWRMITTESTRDPVSDGTSSTGGIDMLRWMAVASAMAVLVLLAGCPKKQSAADASVSGNAGGSAAHAGSTGGSGKGHAGGDGSGTLPDGGGVAGHGTGGNASRGGTGGAHAGAGGGTAGAGGGSGGHAGNGDGGTANLHWYMSCGNPVCTADPKPYDDPSIPNCTTQHIGDPCTTDGDRCDGVASCGATYICTQSAPRTCPVSRAAFKRDIRYLGARELSQYRDQIMSLPLASYRYRDAPDVPQIGFVIDDIEPSAAAAGDHVNMYGYLSMAVAAIQVQQQQIQTLQREIEQLRDDLASKAYERSAAVCGPSQ